MEWRPQKEGIATSFPLSSFTPLNRWNGDLKKKGLRPSFFCIIPINSPWMEWRPQKEGIATFLNLLIQSSFPLMEWRPQKEGIATHPGLKNSTPDE